MRRCAICGVYEGSYAQYASGSVKTAIESHHVFPRGLGGRGKKAPKEADLRLDVCAGSGAGALDRSSCHGAIHHRDLIIEHSRAGTRFQTLSKHLERRGVPADGEWHYTQFGEAYLP